ncbi:MAG: hypothetical protein JO131_07520 [Gammaproteobacteria bacterium]|nr:hypothetical protein [Gammaproteobacteria bacterium]
MQIRGDFELKAKNKNTKDVEIKINTLSVSSVYSNFSTTDRKDFEQLYLLKKEIGSLAELVKKNIKEDKDFQSRLALAKSQGQYFFAAAAIFLWNKYLNDEANEKVCWYVNLFAQLYLMISYSLQETSYPTIDTYGTELLEKIITLIEKSNQILPPSMYHPVTIHEKKDSMSVVRLLERAQNGVQALLLNRGKTIAGALILMAFIIVIQGLWSLCWNIAV